MNGDLPDELQEANGDATDRLKVVYILQSLSEVVYAVQHVELRLNIIQHVVDSRLERAQHVFDTWSMSRSDDVSNDRLPNIRFPHIVEPGLIATEMLAFHSKSSRNKNDSDLMIAIP